MKEKLTLQDIVDLLAKKTSLNKKEADVFFREFFALIIDNTFNNEPVKIKEFGTFKLTKVNSRESIDVNTGEKIEIPAHYKISFLPDKALKSLVNKPFANFETTLLENGVSFDSIEESEEPIDSMDDEDTGVDEAEIKLQPAKNPVTEKIEIIPEEESTEEKGYANPEIPVTIVKDTISSGIGKKIITESAKEENKEIEEPEYIPYVYSYSDTSEEKNTTTIIFSTGIVTEPAIEIKKDEIIPENAKQPDTEPAEIFDKKISDNINENQEEIKNNPPLEINHVQEKINQLKEAIDALTKSTGKEQEIKTGINNFTENKDKKKDEVFDTIIHKNDITGQTDKEDFDTLLWKNPGKVSFKTFETPEENSLETEVVFTDTNDNENKIEPDDDYPDEYDFHDFYKETAFTRFKKKIPVIILLLGLLGFGGYQFYQLFDIKYNYEYDRGYRDYFVKDTINNEPIIIADTSAIILPEPAPVLETDGTYIDETAIKTESEIDLGTAAKELSEEKDFSTERYDKIISENLKIKIAKKAGYIQQKKDITDIAETATPGNKVSATNTPAKGQITYETVKAGSTLRNIAAKHYGNSAFWVFIYEENKDKIENYDNLTIGMTLRLPNATKYGIDAFNSESIRKAKILEQDIFNKASAYRR